MSFIDLKDIGIVAVSHSRMKTHEACARKAMYKFIDKLPEPSNEAMDRGLAEHKRLENWLRKLIQAKYDEPSTMGDSKVHKAIEKELCDLYASGYRLAPEQQMAFTKHWERVCTWFEPAVWMRVIADFMATKDDHAVAGDYKTGQVYDDHDLQADLTAMALFTRHPEVQRVDIRFYYLDIDTIQPYTYHRAEEFDTLRASTIERAERVIQDRTFATNPSWRCKRCHFRKENGGPCVH
jgi:CRISPR/Cas system-associated exonuclease Cas4 (RecB family)